MPRPPTHGRPKAVILDCLRARAKRGPKGERWYWHVERKVDGKWIACGAVWADRGELDRAMARMLSAPSSSTSSTRVRVETVKELLGTWKAYFKTTDVALSTIESMGYVIARLTKFLGDVRLEALPLGALEDFKNRRMRSGTPSSTIVLELRYMKMAWIWGQQRHLVVVPLTLPHVPVEAKRKSPTTARAKQTPSVGDVAAVIRLLEDRRPRHAAALHLQLATGARIGEVASLEWGAVEDGWVTLDGKTGERRVPLAKEAHARLLALEPEEAKRTGRIFEKSTYNALRADLDRLCDLAKVKQFTSHGVRRLVVDELRRAGVRAEVAASITGHHPAVMLTYYASSGTADERTAATAVAKLGKLPRGQLIAMTGGEE
jgi:integrase